MLLRTVVISGLLTSLAACGASTSGGSSQSVPSGGGWTVTDACTTLGKARAKAAFGQPIVATDLSGVHQASEGGVAMSMCTFTTQDKSHFTVLLRQIADSDQTNAPGIEDIRSGGGIAGPAIDLHDLPGTLLWQKSMGTLTWFPDDKRMAVVTVAKNFDGPAMPDDKRLAMSIAIAKALP